DGRMPAEAPGAAAPASVAVHLEQVTTLLQQEIARAAQAQPALGQPPVTQGPAAADPLPQVMSGRSGAADTGLCGLDGSAAPDACPSATTGPASAAGVIVIRPRQ